MRSRCASFAMVVVLPTPFTPIIITTSGALNDTMRFCIWNIFVSSSCNTPRSSFGSVSPCLRTPSFKRSISSMLDSKPTSAMINSSSISSQKAASKAPCEAKRTSSFRVNCSRVRARPSLNFTKRRLRSSSSSSSSRAKARRYCNSERNSSTYSYSMRVSHA